MVRRYEKYRQTKAIHRKIVFKGYFKSILAPNTLLKNIICYNIRLLICTFAIGKRRGCLNLYRKNRMFIYF